ncbi:uncharacterized protein LOC133290251 [Gastrolobium bilobum]|uniref:uncharacterized protein LOC133290251 n=1 Tax=Gastrolobium bilobum TaxID=150636 RepID=UPI002AB18893|nr:uncharacterized protein LOC133290251 [Gastrolobium bilobum]
MALKLFQSAMFNLGYSMDNKEEQCKQIEDYPKEEVKSSANNFKASEFQMPLHYPRYRKEDYEKMEEWRVDLLLKQYGISFKGTLDDKRAFAMGTFLWPDQY